ncbi:MAG: hypothetical protein B7Z74_04885 [Deltaproteobacteria bacterium 21-66-5]|nr:MAG: hypothetical protein B7Z74_04885 [Deltaproteobacteria bacterium 21-66-5]
MIGAHRAGADLDDVIGRGRIGHQHTPLGEHVLPQRADHVLVVLAIEVLDVQVDELVGQGSEVHGADGPVDGGRQEQLLGRGARGVGPLRGAAPQHQRGERGDGEIKQAHRKQVEWAANGKCCRDRLGRGL